MPRRFTVHYKHTRDIPRTKSFNNETHMRAFAQTEANLGAHVRIQDRDLGATAEWVTVERETR